MAAYAGNVTRSEKVWEEFDLAAFTCPSGQVARDRAAHGVPVWQSRYFGDWKNLRLYPTSGAYHSSELPILFGTAEKVSKIPDSAREQDFSRYMASAWVAFASDPQNGLTHFGWPRYNPRGEYCT